MMAGSSTLWCQVEKRTKSNCGMEVLKMWRRDVGVLELSFIGETMYSAAGQ